VRLSPRRARLPFAIHQGLPRGTQGAGVDVDEEIGDFGEAVPPTFWFRDPEKNQLMVVEAR
jgi:hypothetical protein